MRLYFYFLETGKIRCEECEVEEKPKTYKRVDRFPSNFYGCYVRKDDIGKLTGYTGNTVILTEKNTEKVAKIFRDEMNCKISREHDKIIFANTFIKQYNTMLTMIDEWEKAFAD